MGVPKIDITFKELTSTAVARSSRGTVALLLAIYVLICKKNKKA